MIADSSHRLHRLDLESTASYPHAVRRGAPLIQRDRLGQISEVRIGPWRILKSIPLRRIAEVREFSNQRTAVLVERRATPAGPLVSQAWQMYDATGRLTAAVHAKPDGSGALMMNYQTREACRLAPDQNGELEPVATWRF